MAIGLAQPIVESAAATTATPNATYGSNTTAGNTLVAIVNYSGATGTVTVADSLNIAAGNWISLGIRQAQSRTQAWFLLPNTLGGAKPVVTATISASQNNAQILILELTGPCAVDQSIFNSGAATTTPSSGAITTTLAAEFLFSYLAGSNPTAGTSGWTFQVSSLTNRAYEYIANQAVGSYNATYTQSSAAFVCGLFSFFQGVTQQATVAIGAKASVSIPSTKVLRAISAVIAAKASISARPSTLFPVVGGSNIPVGLSTLAVDSSGVLPAILSLLAGATVSASVRARMRPPLAITTGATLSFSPRIFAKAQATIGARASVVPWSTNTLQAIASIAARATVTPSGKRNLLGSSTIQARATVTATAPVLHRATDTISAKASVSATSGLSAVLVVGSSRYAVGASGFAIDSSPVGSVAKIVAHATLTAIAKNLTSVKNSISTGASISAIPASLFQPSSTITGKISIAAVASVPRTVGATIGARASVAVQATVIHKATVTVAASATLLGLTNTTAILVVGSSRFAVGQAGIAVDQSPNSAILFLVARALIVAQSRLHSRPKSFSIGAKASLAVVGGDVTIINDSIAAHASLLVKSGAVQHISTAIHAGVSLTAFGGIIGQSGSTTLIVGATLYSLNKVLHRPKNFSVGAATSILASSSIIRGQVACAIGAGAHILVTPNPSTTGFIVVGSSRYAVNQSTFAIDEGAVGSVDRIGAQATLLVNPVLKGAQSVTINCYGTLSALLRAIRRTSATIQTAGSVFARATVPARATGTISARASITAQALRALVGVEAISAKSTLSITGKVIHSGSVAISTQSFTTAGSVLKSSAHVGISCRASLIALSIIHGFNPAVNIGGSAAVLASIKKLARGKATLATKAAVTATVNKRQGLSVNIVAKSSLSARGAKLAILASIWGTISIRAQGRVLRSVTDNITCWGNLWLVPRVLRNATANLSGKLSMWDYLAVRYSVSDSIHSGSSITARELILRQVKVLISTKASVSASILRGAGIKAAIFPKASLNLPAGVLHRGNTSIFGYASLTPAGTLRQGIHSTIQSEAFVNVWGLVARRAYAPITSRASLSITASVIRKASIHIASGASVSARPAVIHKAQTSISIGSSVHAFGRRDVKISSVINTSIYVSPTALRAFMGGVSGIITSLYPTSNVSPMQAVVSILPGYDLPPGSPPASNLAGIQATIISLDPTSDISIVDPTSSISVIPS